MKVLLLTAAFALIAGCASGPGADATISLTALDCGGCGEKAAQHLESTPGVYAASFDRARAQLNVAYNPEQTEPTALVEAIENEGFDAVIGAGKGHYIKVDFSADTDVQVVADAGQAVDLKSHTVSGKVTVFDFYADWCGPCKDVDRFLAHQLEQRDNLAVRKINVVDWDSEVAGQHLTNVSSLPYLLVYGPDGELRATISGLDLDRLAAEIDEAVTP